MDAHSMGKPEIMSSFRSECDAVESLWLYARDELQCYRVTRMLRSNDLPPARSSEFELRCVMGKARAWRNGFLPCSATSLIAPGTSCGMHIGMSDVLAGHSNP
jgi:hypothetical protein